MTPLVFMFHAGLLAKHVATAIELLETAIVNAGTDAPRFIFAGTNVPPNAPSTEFLHADISAESLAFLTDTFDHTTVSKREWEINAMLRWFVLSDLIHKTGHSGPVIFLDSDVFVYDNIALILSRFDGVFGFSADTHPAVSFFRTPEPIHALRELITTAMRDATLRQHILSELGTLVQSYGGGLQEMGYIKYFCQERRKAGVNISRVNQPVAGGVYDYSINFDQPDGPGFLCDDFGKVAVWRAGLPHFIRRDGALIRAFTLHIHGKAKSRIGKWLPAGHPITT